MYCADEFLLCEYDESFIKYDFYEYTEKTEADMKNNGVMFKVTAKTCKERADKVNNALYDDLLARLDKASRDGQYSLVCQMSDESKSKIINEGFKVESYAGDSWRISWK